jgi:hypothetical protein
MKWQAGMVSPQAWELLAKGRNHAAQRSPLSMEIIPIGREGSLGIQ